MSLDELQSLASFELVQAPGAAVSDFWQTLRQRPGVVPVLLGDADIAHDMLQALKASPADPDAIAKAGLSLDVEAWMAEKIRSRPDYYQDPEALNPVSDGQARRLIPFVPSHDRLGKPYDEVYFALIPVSDPWLVPAHLHVGGWQAYMDAATHVAFFRRWHERYGAMVCTMADATIEMQLSRPPDTLEAALSLAHELFVYCPEVVYVGVGTVGNLAGSILNYTLWYFRWSNEAE